MLAKWVLVMALVLFPGLCWGDGNELSFPSVWNAVRASSPSQRAAVAGFQAAEIGRDRASRHWLPRLYLDARSFSTNDPAQIFFSLLGQREATPADFAPSALNHPGSSFFSQGGLGLDLPLFEGGSKVAQLEARKSEVQARAFAAKAASTEDYLSAAMFYGTLLALREQRTQLTALTQAVESTLRRYQLGGRGNPVGHSGLLGLQGLRNRLQAMLLQNQAQSGASHDSLLEMAKSLPNRWEPERQDFLGYISGALSVKGSEVNSPSFTVQAAGADAESLEKASKGERAKFLPRVGLFAQENLYNGSRGTGTSYAAGAYLQWNLFSPMDYGSVREAELKAAEANGHAEARALGERVEKTQSRYSSAAAEQAIRLLTQNVQLLSEQTDSSQRLYQSGAINALQLVEVLSRRADLLTSLTQAHLELLSARASELKTSSFEVPHE